MEIGRLALLAGVGTIAGFMNVMAGGGSLLTLPAMIFLGIPPTAANGTNRVAILAQNGAAVAGFRGKGFSDFRQSLRLALFGIPGAVAGALAAVRIDPDWFRRLLGIVMIAVLITILRPKRGRRREEAAALPRTVWADLAMVGVGFYVGFIQAGVGFILMAVLHTLLKLDLVRVNMHKVFIVGIFTVPALLVFVYKGEVVWAAGLVLAAGNSLGGWIGSRLAVSRGEGVIRVVFAVAVVAMAFRLLLS